MESFERRMLDANVQVVAIDQYTPHSVVVAAYTQFYNLAMYSGYIGVDTEGGNPRLKHAPQMLQIATETAVIVQDIRVFHLAAFEFLKNIFETPTIVKVFFDMEQDVVGMAQLIGCAVTNCVDLQVLTLCQTDVRLHSLATGVSRAMSPDRWTKASFGERKFDNTTDLISQPGFVQYAAADAWATVYGYGSLIRSHTWSHDVYIARKAHKTHIIANSHSLWYLAQNLPDDPASTSHISQTHPHFV